MFNKKIFVSIWFRLAPILLTLLSAGVLAAEDLFSNQGSTGGCAWTPCRNECPSSMDMICYSDNGFRCDRQKRDPEYGGSCWFGKKAYCCTPEPSSKSECTWAGKWKSSVTGANVQCQFSPEGLCGSLSCSSDGFGTGERYIIGTDCRTVPTMLRLTHPFVSSYGIKSCGHIMWYNKFGDIVESWYKISTQGIAIERMWMRRRFAAALKSMKS